MKPRFFISAVTAEFRETRQLIANVLQRMGYDPVWQDIFGTEQGDLRQMLRNKIDECDGLIHVAGRGYGAESPEIGPGNVPASYTQFELLYAQRRLKKAWVLIAEDGYPSERPLEQLDLPFDPSHPDPRGFQSERRGRQDAWRTRLRAEDNLWHEFATRDVLQVKILQLRDDFAAFRKSFLIWQRVVSVLLILMCLGVGWLVYRQSRPAAEAGDMHFGRPQGMQSEDDVSLDPGGIAHDHFSSTIKDGDTQLLYGKVADAVDYYQDGLKIADRLTEEHPSPKAQRDVAVACQRLGDINLRQNHLDKAREFYEKARGIAEKLVPDSPDKSRARRDLWIAYIKLGDVSVMQGDPGYARELYDRGQAIVAELDRDGRSGQTQRDLSISYIKLGDVAQTLDDAQKYYQQSWEIREGLAKASPPNSFQSQRDFAVANEKLGDVCLLKNDVDAALKYYQKFKEISRGLAVSFSGNNKAKRDWMLSDEKLGEAWEAKGDPAEPRAFYAEARQLAEELAKSDRDDAQAQRDLADACNRLGDLYLQQGDLAAAKECYEKDLKVSQGLAGADSHDAYTELGLSDSYEKLGDVSMAENQFDEARESYQHAFEINKRLADAKQSDADAQCDLAVAYGKLGDVYVKKNKLDEAQKQYQLALDVAKRLAGVQREDADSQRALSNAYDELGEVWVRQKRCDDARELFEKSIRIRKRLVQADPENADDYASLSWSELLNGNFTGAIAAANQGLELNPNHVLIAGNLAHAYLLAGEFDQAEKLYAAYKDKQFYGRPFPQMVADDFALFRAYFLELDGNSKKDRQREDMQKIESLLNQQEKP